MLHALQLVGDAVFAASGALAAGRKRMDVLGAAGLERPVAAVAGMAAIAGLRLSAIFWGLKMPVSLMREE